MKIWYCEVDEAPAPLGEAVEVKTRDRDGETGDATYCKNHAEELGYSLDAMGEWHMLDADTEYLVEEL